MTCLQAGQSLLCQKPSRRSLWFFTAYTNDVMASISLTGAALKSRRTAWASVSLDARRRARSLHAIVGE